MGNGGQRYKYGSTKALPFKAAGFFRLEQADRWWLVTPGGAFLSFGINHIRPESSQHVGRI